MFQLQRVGSHGSIMLKIKNEWALVQDHVRNDPEVLEVGFLEGRENLVQ